MTDSLLQGVKIRALRDTDNRKLFKSGNVALDEFFQRNAGQGQFKYSISSTYVATSDEVIVGYATVIAGTISPSSLSSATSAKFPNHPVPVLLLGRMAVAETCQGKGIGGALLWKVFELAADMSYNLGCVGIVVDAKPGAVSYYERYKFVPRNESKPDGDDSPSTTIPMFLPLAVIRRHFPQKAPKTE